MTVFWGGFFFWRVARQPAIRPTQCRLRLALLVQLSPRVGSAVGGAWQGSLPRRLETQGSSVPSEVVYFNSRELVALYGGESGAACHSLFVTGAADLGEPCPQWGSSHQEYYSGLPRKSLAGLGCPMLTATGQLRSSWKGLVTAAAHQEVGSVHVPGLLAVSFFSQLFLSLSLTQ